MNTARLCVYAIIDRPASFSPDRTGLAGAPLIAITQDDMAAVASAIDAGTFPTGTENVQVYGRVLEALMISHTILPMRFGTLSAGETRLKEALAKRAPEFRQDLMRVAGKVEIGLRIAPRQAETAPSPCALALPTRTSPGLAYLRKRRAELPAQEGTGHVRADTVDALSAVLGPLASEHRWAERRGQAGGVSAEFLLRCENICAFRQAVKDFSTTHADMALFCTGPWPAFSFVTRTHAIG
ncbi:MAG: GvpL/GvpF family gas vesicle protein [Beijerinckiaceae bacterium]